MTEATQRTSDSGVPPAGRPVPLPHRVRLLQDLIANKNVVGVTTNPSIFQKALHEGRPVRSAAEGTGQGRR